MTRTRRRDDRGALAPVAAVVTCFVLFVVAALTVDVGNAWARRGALQNQVDRAAIFAGEFLPAAKASTKLVAAKAAIHYIACHPVPGQAELIDASYAIPTSGGELSCPSTTFDQTSTVYDAAAAAMMASGKITFPNRFEIAIVGPPAKVSFGFGSVAGVEGVTEQKSATSHVYSPGGLVPMGGSVGCLAAALNNTQLAGLGGAVGNVIPINYFSSGTGSATGPTGSSATAPVFPDPNGNGITTPVAVPAPRNRTHTTKGSLTLNTATINSAGTTLNVTFGANPNFPTSQGITSIIATLPSLNLGGQIYGWFRRVAVGDDPSTTGVVETSYTQEFYSTAVSALAGGATLTLPAGVVSSPGDWHVKIIWAYPNYTKVDLTVVTVTTTTYSQSLATPVTFRQSDNDRTFTVPASLADLADLDNFMSCAKPIVSPRVPSGGSDSEDFVRNIRLGLDHTLTQHPSAVTAAESLGNLASQTPATLVAGALGNTSGLVFSCVNGGVTVLDTVANHANQPNCVRVNSKRSWAPEFTRGFLTSSGRLSCQVANCDFGTFTDSNVQRTGTVSYNNDKITDYIDATNKQSVLDDMLLTSLDTFLTPSVPILTPADALSSGIYDSPRFFWAPVLTTAFTLPEDTDETTSGYPILTFRPTFITEEVPTAAGATKIIKALGVETVNDLRQLAAAGILELLGLGPISTLIANLNGTLPIGTLLDNLVTSVYNANKLEAYGLVLDTADPDDSTLKAVRVMNINPGALPAVDPDFAGPVSDYFGSGPKVVRLVQ